MGFQFNGLAAQVTISGSVGVGAIGQFTSSQTPIVYATDDYTLSGGWDVLITPAAGKTFYMTHISATSPAAGFTVRDGGVTNKLYTKINDWSIMDFVAPIKFTTSVTVGGTGGQHILRLTIVGFEA